MESSCSYWAASEAEFGFKLRYVLSGLGVAFPRRPLGKDLVFVEWGVSR